MYQHQPSGISINPNLVDTFNLMFSYGYNAFTANKKLRKIEISEVLKLPPRKSILLGLIILSLQRM